MANVRRKSRSRTHLAEISQRIAEDNPIAAHRWLDELERIGELLAAKTVIGEAFEHRFPGMRRVSYGDYVIYYLPQHDGIMLYRVLHGSRDANSLL